MAFSSWKLPVGTTTLELVTLGRSVTMSWLASGHPSANAATTGVPQRTAIESTPTTNGWRRRGRASRRGILDALHHREMLGDRAERKRREKRQAADDDDCPDEQCDEQGPMRRHRSRRRLQPAL